MRAEDFDKKFDDGEDDIIDDLDVSSARRVNLEQKRINVDFPAWVVESLDREAARIGVTRQSIIKVWLVERLQAEKANSLMETVHLLNSPANAAHLAKSIDQYRAGNTSEHELVND